MGTVSVFTDRCPAVPKPHLPASQFSLPHFQLSCGSGSSSGLLPGLQASPAGAQSLSPTTASPAAPCSQLSSGSQCPGGKDQAHEATQRPLSFLSCYAPAALNYPQSLSGHATAHNSGLCCQGWPFSALTPNPRQVAVLPSGHSSRAWSPGKPFLILPDRGSRSPPDARVLC